MKPARAVPAALSRNLILAGSAVVVMATAGVLLVRSAETEKAPLDAGMSVGKARAIGAEWRREGGEALARQYADALAAAGLYDLLLDEITDRGLLSADPDNAAAYRTEAYFRVGRYEDALSAASFENPYFALARARSRYALTADPHAVERDLATALRGPQGIAAQAFLLRARIALDANDLPTAEAAARRAEEEGAPVSDIRNIGIESLIRDGRIEEAAAKIAALSPHARKSPEIQRLAAMMELRRSRPREGARYFDRTGVASNDRLLAALAKWQAGDGAQALRLIEAHLAAAPDHWAAIDLYLAISNDLGLADDRNERLEKLLERMPALGVIRMQNAGGDADRLFDALAAIDGDEGIEGAVAFLLGRNYLLDRLQPPSESERAMIALAIARKSGDLRKKRALAEANGKPGATALQWAVAGVVFAEAGDDDQAARLFERAIARKPHFFAPVGALADLHSRAGDEEGAIGLLDAFVRANPDRPSARLALASLQMQAGKAADAAENYAALPPMQLFADEATARAYGAAARAAGGAALQTMLDAARASAPSAAILAAALLAAGDDRGAAAALRRTLIAEPANQSAAADYLAAMARLDRTAEAETFLGKVRRLPQAGLREATEAADSPEIASNGLNSRQ